MDERRGAARRRRVGEGRCPGRRKKRAGASHGAFKAMRRGGGAACTSRKWPPPSRRPIPKRRIVPPKDCTSPAPPPRLVLGCCCLGLPVGRAAVFAGEQTRRLGSPQPAARSPEAFVPTRAKCGHVNWEAHDPARRVPSACVRPACLALAPANGGGKGAGLTQSYTSLSHTATTVLLSLSLADGCLLLVPPNGS